MCTTSSLALDVKITSLYTTPMFGIVLRVSLVTLVGAIAFSATPAHAADKSLWVSGQDFKAETVDIETPPADDSCSWTFGKVINEITGVGEYKLLCVEHGARLTLASYYRPDGNQRHYAIKIGGDSNYRRLEGLESRYYGLYLIPDSDTIIVRDYRSARAASVPDLAIYRLEDSPFIPKPDSGGIGVLSYSLDEAKRIPLFGYEHNDSEAYAGVSYFVLSKNHRHILAWLEYRAMVVVDTKTLETRGIDMIQGSWYGGKMNSYPGAISDDGRYAFVERSGFLYDTHGCSVPFDYTYYSTLYKTRPCGPGSDSWTNLKDLVDSEVGNTLHNLKYDFVDDAAGLQFAHPQGNPSKLTTIMTDSYNSQRLDYLAIGDSYSSGEGDIGFNDAGDTYYTPATDYNGGCHLSTRSYPFLLQDAWGISPSKMQSVACSGAELLPDFFGPKDNYRGQNDRLGDVADPDRSYTDALTNFTPGIIRQIEFINKYQPKFITVTAGGNDVGFAKILGYCASPEMAGVPMTPWKFAPVPFTCGYADENSVLNAVLYDSIDTQGQYLSNFFKQVKIISPGTKIIMIGYPSFIASDTNCGFSAGYLNKPEKEMINSAVSYMNRMLKDVAEAEGVLFVDIEDSLSGGRMCEGSEFVTNLGDLGIKKIYDNQVAEAFHPNASGHIKIADRVVDSGVYDQQMPQPELSNNIQANFTAQASMINSDVVLSTGSSVDIDTATQSFADGTSITTVMFSDTTELGSFRASSDGALHATLDLSNVRPGKHVLVVEGTSPSGDPTTLYQFITVHAAEDDADGDGIPNDEDVCNFFDSWLDEQTGQDICVVQTVDTTSDEIVSDDTGYVFEKLNKIENAPPINRHKAVINPQFQSAELQGTSNSSYGESIEGPSVLSYITKEPDTDAGNNHNDMWLIWASVGIIGTIGLGGRIIYGRFCDKKY